MEVRKEGVERKEETETPRRRERRPRPHVQPHQVEEDDRRQEQEDGTGDAEDAERSTGCHERRQDERQSGAEPEIWVRRVRVEEGVWPTGRVEAVGEVPRELVIPRFVVVT